MRRLRGGWTVHEMLVSLAVTGLIVTLAAGAAMAQLRFFRGAGEIIALRTQLAQATMIGANVLRQVGSAADIHYASDSAVELSATVGSSVTCRADTARLVVAARGGESGNTLGSYVETPDAGDVAHVLIRDGLATPWMAVRVAGGPSGQDCARFGVPGWSFALDGPLVIPAGAPVRFIRRMRLSLYRASDDRWYLGHREWNEQLGRFNTIQPVAGPLAPFSRTNHLTGFRFGYTDSAGVAVLSPPWSQIRLVTLVARGVTRRPARVAGISSPAQPFYHDSVATAVAIPR